MRTERKRWPWWWILFWVILAVPVWAWQVPQFLHALKPRRTEKDGRKEIAIVDFFQEWASGRFYRDGRPVYGPLADAVERYLHYRAPDDERFNRVNAHPPTSIVILLPLSWLDYPEACFTWNLLSLGGLVVSVWLCIAQLRPPVSPWVFLPLSCLIWWCSPFLDQVIYGQLNLFLLLLLTATWAADHSGHPNWAGFWLGTAAAVKLFPALLFLYFLVRGRWRVVFVGAAVVVAWTGLTVLLLGTEAYVDYVRVVMPRLATYRDSYPNISLPGFWHKLFDASGTGGHSAPLYQQPLLAKAAIGVSTLVILGLLAWFTWKARERASLDHAFGLHLFAMLLLSPIAWAHYALLLVLPLLLLWLRLPRGYGLRILFYTCLVLLWVHPYVFYVPVLGAYPSNFTEVIAQPRHSLTVTSYHTYALLILFALGCLMVYREDRAADRMTTPEDS